MQIAYRSISETVHRSEIIQSTSLSFLLPFKLLSVFEIFAADTNSELLII